MADHVRNLHNTLVTVERVFAYSPNAQAPKEGVARSNRAECSKLFRYLSPLLSSIQRPCNSHATGFCLLDTSTLLLRRSDGSWAKPGVNVPTLMARSPRAAANSSESGFLLPVAISRFAAWWFSVTRLQFMPELYAEGGVTLSIDSKLKGWTVPLFKAVGKSAPLASLLGLVVYLILLVIGCSELLRADAGGIKGLTLIWLKAAYGLWTICVPVFFFAEYLANAEKRIGETEEDRKLRLDELKVTQQLARDVWLACAAVVGLLLFKGP